VDFGISNRPIGEPNLGPSFSLASPPLAVSPLEAPALPDSSTSSERLDVGDGPDDGEVHVPWSPRNVRTSIRRPNDRGISRGAFDTASRSVSTASTEYLRIVLKAVPARVL
jgi:hypothetical protein